MNFVVFSHKIVSVGENRDRSSPIYCLIDYSDVSLPCREPDGLEEVSCRVYIETEVLAD